MEGGFRALYVDPGFNLPPAKEIQFPNQAVHFLTNAVSSSTGGRRSTATKLMMFIRVFCLGVHPHTPNFNVGCGVHFFFQLCLGAFCPTLKLGCGVFILEIGVWGIYRIWRLVKMLQSFSACCNRWSFVLFFIFSGCVCFLSRPDTKTESAREKYHSTIRSF